MMMTRENEEFICLCDERNDESNCNCNFKFYNTTPIAFLFFFSILIFNILLCFKV